MALRIHGDEVGKGLTAHAGEQERGRHVNRTDHSHSTGGEKLFFFF